MFFKIRSIATLLLWSFKTPQWSLVKSNWRLFFFKMAFVIQAAIQFCNLCFYCFVHLFVFSHLAVLWFQLFIWSYLIWSLVSCSVKSVILNKLYLLTTYIKEDDWTWEQTEQEAEKLMLMPIGCTMQTGNDSNVARELDSVQSQKSAFHCILCNAVFSVM